METMRKSCCARAMGWAVVGIIIAAAWGIGNLTSGMTLLEAFAIPAVILTSVVGVIALALFDVPWFARLCACDQSTRSERGGTPPGRRDSSLGETTS